MLAWQKLRIVRDMLYSQDVNICKVARDTGLHYQTLRAIRDGKTASPGIDTLDKLVEYFSSRDDT
jgi:transposase-like protein